MNEFDETENEEFEFDGSDVEAKSFVSWEDKKEYDFVVKDVKKSISTSSGNPMLVWELKFPQVNGWTITHYTVVKGDGKFKAMEIMVALGLGEQGSKISFKKEDAIGRRGRAKIRMEEYEGKPRAKIAYINPHKDGPVAKDEALPF